MYALACYALLHHAVFPHAVICCACHGKLDRDSMRQCKGRTQVAWSVNATDLLIKGMSIAFLCTHKECALQVGAADGVRSGFVRTVQQVYSQKGFFGFYTGFKVGLLKTAPMGALSFGTYELVRTRLDAQTQSTDALHNSTQGLLQTQAQPES